MNLMDLMIKIGIDDQASSAISKVTSGIGKGISTAAKVGTAALAAAGTAIVAVSKQAIDGYANYEQLVGGSKLLFGEAYDYIAEKASTAFKDVQMSQNDYLQQVNGFAVGLKTAMGGNAQAAAELAAKIVSAEADVVAATGNTQEAVQNAFNGIMKNNYTMLDNLQLGITPTKEGMQEVIDKVNEWNAANGEASEYSIENLADVQSALVDYIEMQGLAGYAAMESSETITGSLSMLKGAWSDLLAGLADDEADFGQLVANVVESAGAVAENLMPRITKAIGGIGQLIGELAPVVIEQVPAIISEVLPALSEGMVSIVETVAQVIPQIVDVLVGLAPTILPAAIAIIEALGRGLVQIAPQLMSAALEIVLSLMDYISQNASQLVKAATELILKLADFLMEHSAELATATFEMINAIVMALIENAPQLVTAAVEIIIALANGLLSYVGELVSATGEVFQAMLDRLKAGEPLMSEEGRQQIRSLMDGIKAKSDELIQTGQELWQKFKDTLSKGKELGQRIVDDILSGLKAAWESLRSWFSNAWQSLVGNLHAKATISGSTTSGKSGSFASGLEYVPRDGYIAQLHKGERILTAEENAEYGRGKTVINNFYPQTMSEAEMDYFAVRVNQQLGAMA